VSEPFSRSLQKRIEAQTGEKLFTKRDLDLAVLEARIEEAEWWADGAHGPEHPDYERCGRCVRIADLQKQKAERAASISENNP
jgi:hypothetical protein